MREDADDVATMTSDARFYRALYRIRRVEEEIAGVYPTDKIQSPIHLSIGQEAIAVGVCEALEPADVVFGTYRSHALYLAKGGDLNRMIAELYGKATGCARGKGGSMHLIDVTRGVMGASAVVGTTIPQSVGYAYALELKGRPAVVASFFGDGAAEQGVFYESLSFAALKRLPILFVCENNHYAVHAPLRARQPLDNIADRPAMYGIPSVKIHDGDILAIHEAAERAIDDIRRGAGPMFLECVTYRWKQHVGPNDDFGAGSRSQTEAETWFARDPVKTVAAHVDPDARAAIEVEVDAEIREAFAFAERSPYPADDDLFADVLEGS